MSGANGSPFSIRVGRPRRISTEEETGRLMDARMGSCSNRARAGDGTMGQWRGLGSFGARASALAHKGSFSWAHEFLDGGGGGAKNACQSPTMKSAPMG